MFATLLDKIILTLVMFKENKKEYETLVSFTIFESKSSLIFSEMFLSEE